jgi:PAS domain-containing protein
MRWCVISSDGEASVEGDAAADAPEARARLRGLEAVEALVGDGIVTLDVTGLVVGWNAAARDLTGYTAEEVRGSSVSVLYTEEDRAADLPGRELGAPLGRPDGSMPRDGGSARTGSGSSQR